MKRLAATLALSSVLMFGAVTPAFGNAAGRACAYWQCNAYAYTPFYYG